MTDREQKIGLTFSQIVSVISLAAAIIGVYVSLNVRISNLELSVEALKENQRTTMQYIERVRIENREEHQIMVHKLDLIIEHDKRQ